MKEINVYKYLNNEQKKEIREKVFNNIIKEIDKHNFSKSIDTFFNNKIEYLVSDAMYNTEEGISELIGSYLVNILKEKLK